MTNETQNENAGLREAARASFDAAKAPANLSETKRAAKTASVATGLVDLLVDRAQTGAALGAVAVDLSPGARDVWQGVLESLQACDLSPVIYCTKSGRALGVVQPEPWADYLHHIATLGECGAADTLQGRLLSAIVAQKAQAVAPAVLHGAADALAVVRRVSPADFLIRTLSGYIFPPSNRADMVERAQRAENMGAARASLNSLAPGALSYACEVSSLLLSYVDTRRDVLPELAHYTQGAVDFAAIVASPSTIGHFCGRVVQAIVKMLSRKSLRPLSSISARDLLALRVDWGGVPEYQALRAARRDLAAAERQEAKKFAHAMGRKTTLTEKQARAMQTESGRAVLDAIDLSLIFGASGRPVSVAVDDPAQASAAIAQRDAMAQLRAENSDTGGDDGLQDWGDMDVSSLIASGLLPDSVLTVTDDDETDGFALEFAGALETALEGLAGDDDDLSGFDFEGAAETLKPVAKLPRAPAKPKTPKSLANVNDDTVTALLSALDDPTPANPKPTKPLAGMFKRPAAPAAKPAPTSRVIAFPRLGAPKPS